MGNTAKMKVLVTGGAGYIGSVLVRELQKKGYAVKVFDKLYFGRDSLNNIENKIELIQGDIRSIDKKNLDGVDAVCHLAGLSNDPTAEYNPSANIDINTYGTYKLAEICAEKGVNKFIFASSASIYDRGLSGSDELQDEKTNVPEPERAYSKSKFKAEQVILEIAEKNPNFCPVVLRQGTVYGASPRMRYDLVVNSMVKSAFEKGIIMVFCGGIQWRPLVDVRDISSVYITILEASIEKVKKQIFNVVAENIKILDLANIVKKNLNGFVNTEIEINYDERIDRSYRISNNKLKTGLGFRYDWNVETSVIDIAKKIKHGKISDFNNPIYYNIKWMEHLINSNIISNTMI